MITSNRILGFLLSAVFYILEETNAADINLNSLLLRLGWRIYSPGITWRMFGFKEPGQAAIANQENEFLSLDQHDSDPYFNRMNNGRYTFYYLCDKFSNWSGYTVQEIQESIRHLPITEQSSWEKWDFNEEWVFLGYRGTNQKWAQVAGDSQYQVNSKRWDDGHGIYMTPHRCSALDYTKTWSDMEHGRICYNFAPKRMLEKLLICGGDDHWSMKYTRQRIKKPPREVSARVDILHSDPQVFPHEVIYPEPFAPFIRVVCIEAPSHEKDIPELFRFNNIYYDKRLRMMALN